MPLGVHLTRRDLWRPGVRVLNRGGVANADVLLIQRPGMPGAVVKDYGERSAAVRALLAPLLVRRELALLRRLEGLPGVPRPLGRLDRLALVMEHVDGHPLDRSTDAHALQDAFFDALQGILDGLAVRGLCYLDLRSSSNVVRTPTDAPALVDLASATVVWVPIWLRRWLERRSLAKLRSRFLAARYPRGGGQKPTPAARLQASGHDVRAGRLRLRYRDAGRVEDPNPMVLVHDVGLSSATFLPLLEAAASSERRVVALDLAGCGGSARPNSGYGLRRQARDLVCFLRALRLGPVDLVGWGFGGLIARAARARDARGIRSVAVIDPPDAELREPFWRRWQAARQGPERVRALLSAEIERSTDPVVADVLTAALAGTAGRVLVAPYRSLRVRGDPPQLAERALGAEPDLRLRSSGELPIESPERLWAELMNLGVR
ncbi:MAG: alpha/beta hydrolase [Myxococcales bacterium]|nr:alpha/beta hydrolase [Myxococcales bacterium]